MALFKYEMKSIMLVFWLVVVAALGIGVFAMQKSKDSGSQRIAPPGEAQEIARSYEQRQERDKPKEAGRACFLADKEMQKKDSMLYEGSDVLLRNGKTLTIRVRTLDNQSSDSYRRGIFTCEIVEKGEIWSVVRIEPAG